MKPNSCRLQYANSRQPYYIFLDELRAQRFALVRNELKFEGRRSDCGNKVQPKCNRIMVAIDFLPMVVRFLSKSVAAVTLDTI